MAEAAREIAPLVSFGALLKRHRVRVGLSQEALAERAGLSADAVNSLETGRRQAPYRDTVAQLARALDLPASDHAALEATVVRRRGALGPASTPPAPSAPHNLPALTALFGRECEVVTAAALLQRPDLRLLTLTGPGGVGKTRLALAVAKALLPAHPDGVWLIELAALTDHTMVASAASAALGLRDRPGIGPLAALTVHLAEKRALLVLDNCEHLLGACAEFAAALLQACAHLRLLATSREGLAIAAEHLFRVPSLAFPDPARLPPAQDLPSYGAVALLLDRAQARQADFALTAGNAAAVAEVCARLDGMPLAIELAAARLNALPVEQIAARLGDRFRLLTGGSRAALPRQRTLRATIDWSWDLLSGQEQVLLRRLAVFAGGWTVEAAEALCDDGPPSAAAAAPGCDAAGVGSGEVLALLIALVDKSLVAPQLPIPADGALAGSEMRYRLLETVRQYAGERLEEAGESTRVADRHLAWCLTLAEAGAVGIAGPDEVAWLRRLEVEHDNLRAALAWSALTHTLPPEGRPHRPEPRAGLRLANALLWFWMSRGHLREGLGWLAAVLADDGAPSTARARALAGAGYLTMCLGNEAAARTLLQESLDLGRALKDPVSAGEALHCLGVMARSASDLVEARRLLEESATLLQAPHCEWRLARVLRQLGSLHQGLHLQNFEAAGTLLAEGLRLARAAGQPSGVAMVLCWLGNLALDMGEVDRAAAMLEEGLSLAHTLGDTILLGDTLANCGLTAAQRGDTAGAAAHFSTELALGRAIGSIHFQEEAIFHLACLALEGGEIERTAALVGEALALPARSLREREPDLLADFGMLLACALVPTGRPERVVQLLGAAALIRDAIGAHGTITLPVAHLYARARIAADRALDAARAALDEDVFATAWAHGRAVCIEDLIASALAEVAPIRAAS